MNLAQIAAGFVYDVEHYAPDGRLLSVERVHNIIPTEGLNHIAGVVFKGVTAFTDWYLAPFEGNYTPVSTVTAATIAAAATECITYAETTRVLFNEGAVSAGALDNTLNKAEFTFTANKTIYGGFLVSTPAKAAVTGVLMSLVRFSSPKVMESGGTLKIVTGVAFTSA